MLPTFVLMLLLEPPTLPFKLIVVPTSNAEPQQIVQHPYCVSLVRILMIVKEDQQPIAQLDQNIAQFQKLVRLLINALLVLLEDVTNLTFNQVALAGSSVPSLLEPQMTV
jgi:hypothetical protein